tara:strand:+ start:86 stop:319 length:234 start_codon:yes stop_codon:yes gene_type:complete
MREDCSEFVRFQITRKVTGLYKQFLFILEDVKDDNANKIDDKSYQRARKRILDFGNDTIREMEEDFSKLKITLKEKE